MAVLVGIPWQSTGASSSREPARDIHWGCEAGRSLPLGKAALNDHWNVLITIKL